MSLADLMVEALREAASLYCVETLALMDAKGGVGVYHEGETFFLDGENRMLRGRADYPPEVADIVAAIRRMWAFVIIPVKAGEYEAMEAEVLIAGMEVAGTVRAELDNRWSLTTVPICA